MKSFLSYVAQDTEENANKILEKTINVDIDLSMEKDPNVDTLNGFLESEQNLSITSTGSIVPASINKSPSPSNVKATKKRDTSKKYVERLAYRRTTYTKKYNTLKSTAEALASQCGAEIKIIIYNPDNGKTEEFHTLNLLLTQRREPGVEYVAPVVQEQLVPTYHSPSKSLNPPAPVVDAPAAVISMSPLREINTNTDILPGLSIKNLPKSKNTMKSKSTNTRTKMGKMLGKKIAGKPPTSKQSIAKKVKTLAAESFRTVSSVSKTVSSETITRPK